MLPWPRPRQFGSKSLFFGKLVPNPSCVPNLKLLASTVPVKFGADIFIQSGVIDIFSKFKMAVPPSWIYRLCEFGYSGVLTVWYLCSIPNWVKIYAMVTEIDALMLQMFI